MHIGTEYRTSHSSQRQHGLWGPTLLAAICTLLIYLILPLIEHFSKQPEKALQLRSVDRVQMPTPPPPPPPEKQTLPKTVSQNTAPKPTLQSSHQKIPIAGSGMNLGLSLDSLPGDFLVNFEIAAPAAAGEIETVVFDVAELDVPPQPLSQMQPIYPPRARRQKIQGVVDVEFVIHPDSKIDEIKVLSASPAGVFDAAALHAVNHWRFSPGTINSKPVTTRVRQRISFVLGE